MTNTIIDTELKSISAISVKTVDTYTIVEELLLYELFCAVLGLVEISLENQTNIE